MFSRELDDRRRRCAQTGPRLRVNAALVRDRAGGRASSVHRGGVRIASGCAWRHLPPAFGVSVPTAHRRFMVWADAGSSMHCTGRSSTGSVPHADRIPSHYTPGFDPHHHRRARSYSAMCGTAWIRTRLSASPTAVMILLDSQQIVITAHRLFRRSRAASMAVGQLPKATAQLRWT